jgi:hypothetical protein
MKPHILFFVSLSILSSCNEGELSRYTPPASSICSGTTVLGVAGTAECSGGGGSSSFSSIMASFAYRSDNGSVNLLSQAAVDARIQSLLSDEIEGNATFSDNSSLVPNPVTDTDGRYSSTGIPAKRNYLETVKGGRPDKVCGLTGTIEERIEECASENTTSGVNKALYEGAKYGQSGEGDWKLVTLYVVGGSTGDLCAGGSATGCFEVWRDERTKLVWSDIHSNNGSNWNWFKAAGYSSITTTAAATGHEGQANTGTDCSLAPCQPLIPISVCADAGAIANHNGVATYQNPDGTNGTFDERPAKGNLTGASRQWRLPTSEDWQIANVNGIRKVLPNMDVNFWSSSSYSNNRLSAWYFYGDNGNMNVEYRIGTYSVRCVAPSRD